MEPKGWDGMDTHPQSLDMLVYEDALHSPEYAEAYIRALRGEWLADDAARFERWYRSQEWSE